MKYIINRFKFLFCLICLFLFLNSCLLFKVNNHIYNKYSRFEKNKFEKFIFQDSLIFNYYCKPFENNELLLFSKGLYRKIAKNKFIITYDSYEKIDTKFEEFWDHKLSDDSLTIIFSKNSINEFFHEVCIEINDSIYELTQLNTLDVKIKKPQKINKLRIFYTTPLAYTSQIHNVIDDRVNLLKIDFLIPKTKLYTRVFGFECDECIFSVKESEKYSINLFKNNCKIIDTLYLIHFNRLNYSRTKWNLKKEFNWRIINRPCF